MSKFNTQLADSQAIKIDPIPPSKFDFGKYMDYEKSLDERCKNFWEQDSGVLVYRRMRVGDVFSYGCRDMKKSLEWQLGALQKSIDFKADVPNFLEPWYGIGTTASAFGIGYKWFEGQSPSVYPKFNNVQEALEYPCKDVKDTEIGRHTLNMVEYFMDKTKGRLPMSYCDIQAPFNIAPNVVNSSSLFTDMYLNPGSVLDFLDLLADLIINFTREQEKRIGNCLVRPGHSFASSRNFGGFGMSEDNMVMVDEDLYSSIAAPSFEKTGNIFGGAVFHSCGNYSDKLNAVKRINNIRMLDAAFSEETDPDPNPPEAIRDMFINTGTVVNARIVGNLETIESTVSRLWKPGMKLVVVTYCKTPEEQSEAYDLVHAICK